MKVIATKDAGFSQQYGAEIIKGQEYEIEATETLPDFFALPKTKPAAAVNDKGGTD
jgi:hypothetical protein